MVHTYNKDFIYLFIYFRFEQKNKLHKKKKLLDEIIPTFLVKKKSFY
jgi:hypothetical protein